MSTTGSRVLSKMLDRLLAGLMSGPNMNCRPHKSRQRIDLSQLSRLSDIPPEDVLRGVLGAERCAKAVARVKLPRKLARATVPPEESTEPAEPKSANEKAWLDQSALLSKMRVIADDARTYENDTGVHALSIGFPLLSLPPGSFGNGARPGTKRILAPIAFIPVTLILKGGATPSAEIACHSDGADRVRPNPALLSWIEQQTGKPLGSDLFEDEEGTDPWREITQLVEHVAKAVGVEIPTVFIPPPPPPAIPPSPGASGDVRGEGDFEVEETQPSTPNVESDFLPLKVERPAVNVERLSDTEEERSTPNENGVAEPITLKIPETLALGAAPRGDEDDQQPAILISAVLGLFPTAHQGLVRDTRAMITDASDGIAFSGPIQSFLTTGIDFDAVVPQDVPIPAVPVKSQTKSIADQRLAAAADPCQALAVALARDSAALVVHGPPGTGKSQTITNIIADHLSRGQRVLLVCEKRTALDVVADRLEHMGLRSLCGIVHDPQRDQRDLYRSIRQQLDDLPEAKTHPRADAGLAKVDAELQQLHDELTGFHRSLMSPTATGGSSFHELMGQWMAAQPTATVKLDDVVTAGITTDELERQRAGLVDLFRRARVVDFSRNLWAKCAGISIADFLARPMSAVRTAIERCNAAAVTADSTAAVNIPAFSEKVPIAVQGKARGELAGHLTEMLPIVQSVQLTPWADHDPAQIRAGLVKLSAAQSIATTFAAGPLDPELKTLVNPLPAPLKIAQQRVTLQAYQDVAAKWTAMFSFSTKAQAADVLKEYGLPLNAAEAARLQNFLIGVQARVALSGLRSELLAAPRGTVLRTVPETPISADSAPAGNQIASDEELAELLAIAPRWFDLLLQLRNDPAADGLAPLLAAAMKSNEATADFLDGLARSASRAEAVIRLEDELTQSALFDADWLADFDQQLRAGKLATETTLALGTKLDTLEGVLRVRAGRAAVPEKFQPVVDLLLSQVVDADPAMSAIQTSVVANEIRGRLRSDPQLQAIDAHRVESAFDRFRELDKQKKLLVRDFISHHWTIRQQDRLLATTGKRLNAAGAALRQRLLMRGEHAIRLRQVVARGEKIDGGDPLFDLCPVWMASPETVAQIFPRKAMFDVVIFDEASQCRLEEALPVLTRGRRVVIAGDPNQLPPTRFFESGLVQSEDEEPETEQELFESQQGEIEDLLAAALNLAIQQCYLDVHYRSRNADLIEFSNQNFYASRLQAIPAHPSNRAKSPPLKLYRLAGVYGKRSNEAEADRVVAIVQELLDRGDPPSIGIACLNLPQRDLIVEKLDDLAAEDAEFGKRLAAARIRKGAGSFEGLFVKNLENVQGDERDDIIISTTYGPDANGKFYRRFGPVGMAGGGRRLNVLVTRARSEVHLVTSIPVEAYRTLPAVPEGQAPTGAWMLFAYLKYAERLAAFYEAANVQRSTSDAELSTAVAADATVNVLPTRSPSMFAHRLADELASGHRLGSEVHFGNDGFCVDLAMHHPTRPGDVTIGVLCDGCRYAAANDPVEWDIFRTGILESQGWTLRRVWTPHYFRDPNGNDEEIIAAAAKFDA